MFKRFSSLRARTEKGIRQTLKMILKAIPTSMQNRYKTHDRKSDAKNKEISETGSHQKLKTTHQKT